MKIRFFDKKTNKTITEGYYYVDRNGDVYKDNEWYTESQAATVSFDDFADLCVDVGWEVYQECPGAND